MLLINIIKIIKIKMNMSKLIKMIKIKITKLKIKHKI
jgi:hypothetical protein